ncbi:uncharacterized protein [Mytilus edulis]|uniref:Chitin-binding type-4 domain-containing protein n=1 Tax=Mytilus edulis TaxID=6550 RepID=A0A8S3QBV6_MYTED|nr:unnamed protein product [Mytilus edulis]
MKAVFFLLVVKVVSIHGHAFLMDPPYRAYAAGYSTPQGMNCGGISHQWDRSGGVCGVCGDAYGGVQNNMAGGKFATGAVTATYNQGQTIDVTVKITANHLGFFNFSLCVNNDFTKKITEECLSKHPLTITDPDNGFTGLEWDLPGHVTLKTLKLHLPANVHCTQCVLRWYWKGGNNWGRDPVTGVGCKGCAEKQECFVNCADIEIVSNGQPAPTAQPAATTKATNSNNVGDGAGGCAGTVAPRPVNGKQCTAKDPSLQDEARWCQKMCSETPLCPTSHCVCM